MRIIILLLASISVISAQAQTALPVNSINYTQQDAFSRHHILNDSNGVQKNWFVSGYAGMGTGIGFYNGANTAFLPAQIGLQLNRRLNKNLYAFAAVSATPVLFNFNRSYTNTDWRKNYMTVPAFGANGMGIYSGIQAGLMYVNDQKTFSISGSIGVSQRDPFYPSPGVINQKQPAFTGSRQ